MNKKIIKGLLLIVVVFLSGCAKPQYTDGTISKSKILNKQQAFVVTKIAAPYLDLNEKLGKYPGFMVIQNNHKQDYKYYIDGTTYKTAAIMIHPGSYTIVQYGWSDGAFIYVACIEDTIEVKPGDCIYLGDINIIKKNTSVLIHIHDNLNSAVQELNAKDMQDLTKNLKYYKLKDPETTESKND